MEWTTSRAAAPAVALHEPEQDGAAAVATGSVSIDIPKASVGKVIGAKGKTISHVRSTSGAEVQLTKDAHGNGTVVVRGATTHRLNSLTSSSCWIAHGAPVDVHFGRHQRPARACAGADSGRRRSPAARRARQRDQQQRWRC